MIKRTLISIFILTSIIYSQDNAKDSIYAGRKCTIILFNGFESEGEITSAGTDTITFKNEYTEYRIPRNQIKAVNRWAEADEELIEEQMADTSEYCDIYLDGGTKFNDIKLMKDTDSTIVIVIRNKLKTYKIESIRKIVFTRSGFGSGFLVGLGIGTATTMTFLIAWGGDFIPGIFYGALFSVPVGIIGGIIGAVLAKNETYIFEKGYTKSKSKKINYIIEKHKQ